VELDSFELPRIEEIISSLNNKKYFTSIDLENGFFQIPIKEEDKHKTTFFTDRKLMQFRRMPQGFKNSPAIFQRAMSLIFGEIIGKKCIAYVDDILVFGETIKEHDENLKHVLNLL
jgi:hypothetical protein